jgi:glycerol kinase
MKKYILALDSGTTSNRAIIFDQEGSIRGQSQQEFRQVYPSAGLVEHDPEEIWSVQLSVARELLEKTGLNVRQIAGIGITNQRETTLVWERGSGRPVCNAIVWQDRRTAGYCDTLKKDGKGGMVRDKTGLVIDAYFSASKLKWILDNVEGAREKAVAGELAFGTIDTWLVWKLTGGRVHATDVSNASRTMLFNIHSLEWDMELLELFGIPSKILPEVHPSSGICGLSDPALFGHEIPIAGMAGDQQAALFGQMCVDRGMAKNTYGTGCFIVLNTGPEIISSKQNLLSTVAWKTGDEVTYALEGSIFIAGAVVQWLRDKLKIIRSSGEIEELAGEADGSGGVFFVPAFVGLGAPHWDPYATGTIIGINRDTSGANIARAALESIALQSYDVIRAMELDSGITMKELRVDGGASVNNLLMQIQADVLNIRVIRPAVTETTAMGAAFLAGLGVGFWKDVEQIRKLWKEDRTFTPDAGDHYTAGLLSGWEKALKRSSKWNNT